MRVSICLAGLLLAFCVAMPLFAAGQKEAEGRYIRIREAGTYVAYEVEATIFADGHVFYKANGAPVVKGLRHYNLDPTVFEQISELLDTSFLRQQARAKRSGEACATHSSYMTIEDVSRERRERGRDGWRPIEVQKYLGCDFDGRDQFIDLYRQVFKMLELEALVGTEEEQTRTTLCEIFISKIPNCRTETKE